MDHGTLDKSQFIRDEFECFVRIGMDNHLRSRVLQLVEHRLLTGGVLTPVPTIYFEVRTDEGALCEMWHLEADVNQLRRLLEFLRRFSIAEVQMIDGMLQR